MSNQAPKQIDSPNSSTLLSKDINRTIIIGGDGKMAKLLLPYLPNPVTIIDKKRLDEIRSSRFLPDDRAIRRQTSSALSETTRATSSKNNFGSLCIISVPNEVYDLAAQAPGKSKVSNLLGVSGRGYRDTLFVHQTSSHSTPAEILDDVSGVVMGVHMLHGPMVQDFSKETVVLTATERMRRHNKYKAACDYLSSFYRLLGYRRIYSMTPARHDTLMSDIQFLSHSMLLVVGDAILSSGYTISPENYHDLPSSILVLLGRMGKQSSHVYEGIATGNRYTTTVLERLNEYARHDIDPSQDWVCGSIGLFKAIRDDVAKEIGLTPSERMNICTPMSRVRDGIMSYSLSEHRNHTGIPALRGSMDRYISRYLAALTQSYTVYFDDVIGRTKEKLRVLDVEALTMQKFEAIR